MGVKDKKHPAIKVLNKHKSIVWPEIQKYLKDPKYPKQFTIAAKYKPIQKYHWKIVSDYPKRKSKYVRPTFVLLTAKSMGINQKKALKTAAAMQISEEWILGHDDIQDDSPLRRGKPSLHKIYGTALAVNAGDTLHSLMWKVLADNFKLLGPKKGLEIINEFVSILMRTELGQTADIKWFQENKLNFTDNDWRFIADSKSGYYSIGGPIRLGAILANATEDQLNKLTNFGKALGTCWQLVDDILDITGDIGGRKIFANDIYEGKRTVPLGH